VRAVYIDSSSTVSKIAGRGLLVAGKIHKNM